MLGRAVFMKGTVLAAWIIRKLLELASTQGDLETLPELINSDG